MRTLAYPPRLCRESIGLGEAYLDDLPLTIMSRKVRSQVVHHLKGLLTRQTVELVYSEEWVDSCNPILKTMVHFVNPSEMFKSTAQVYRSHNDFHFGYSRYPHANISPVIRDDDVRPLFFIMGQAQSNIFRAF